MIDIKGIDKAELLAALHNGTGTLGLGAIHDVGHLTVEKAREIIGERLRTFTASRWVLDFEYVYGRPVKSNITGDELDPALYDRDAGQGAAARIIAELRERMRLQQAGQ